MKKSNSHTQNRIKVSDKDPIFTPKSHCVDIGMLSEIERSDYHRT